MKKNVDGSIKWEYYADGDMIAIDYNEMIIPTTEYQKIDFKPLIKNEDKYLLEQTTERNNYKWAIPGGHVLSGETPEVALKRELEEELGIRDIKYKKVDTIKFPYNNYIFNVFYSNTIVDINLLT